MRCKNTKVAKFKMISLVLVITMLLQILMPVIIPLKSVAVDNNGRIETSLGTIIIREAETTVEEGIIPIEIHIDGTSIFGITAMFDYDRELFEELKEEDIHDIVNGWNIEGFEDFGEGIGYNISMSHSNTKNGYDDFTACIINLKLKSPLEGSTNMILTNVVLTDTNSNNTEGDEGTDEYGCYNITYNYQPTAPTSYSITYNKNTEDNVSDMPSNETVNAGTTHPIPTQEPKREGYVFTGWNTNANGTGTSYTPGTSYEINSNLDLYAQWRPLNTYTITYNKNSLENDVTGMPTENGTKIEGTDYTLAPAPSRTGYTFGGWNTQADGEGTSYVAEALYREDASVELFAKWVPVKSTLTVDPNGGVWEGHSTSESYTKDYKTTMQIPNPTQAPAGNRIKYEGNDGTPGITGEVQTKKFDGWTLTGGGTLSGNTYTFGTESGTLTANYSLNPVVLPSASKTGARIKGWFTAQTGGTLIGQPGEEYTPTTQTTLFARYRI